MSNEYFNVTPVPTTGAALSSSTIRAEFALVAAIGDKLPVLAGNGSKACVINAGGTAVTVTTGTLTLAGNFATSGASAITLTSSGATNVTLPTTGTLATLAGTETLSNKTISVGTNEGISIKKSVADVGTWGVLITSSVGTALGLLAVGNNDDFLYFGANDASITTVAVGGVTAGACSGGINLQTDNDVIQFKVLHTASATNYATVTGSNGGNPTISTSAGSLAITPAVVMAGDLEIGGGDLTTSQTTFNLINTTATTVNFAGGASTALNIGHASGTNTILGATTFSQAITLSSASNLGTPATLVGTNITGTAASLTAGTASAVAVGGVTGLGTGVATFLATPSSANLASAVTNETGSGALVFGTSPAITTSLTTPSSSFDLINTTATTVNFAGGASTALNVGHASGTLTHLGVLVNNKATYIGDTSNAKSTLGLTINQGAATDEILSLKCSDATHGMTSDTETDTFGKFTSMNIAGSTKLRIDGYGELTGGLILSGNHVTDDTTKSTSGLGAIWLLANLKSGTTVGDCGANANLVVVRNGTTTRFILDADGDSHQDVGTAWTNFDHLDDVEVLDALSYHVSRDGDPIKRKFGEWMAERRDVLSQQRLVAFNEDGHHFVNMSRLAMLHTGAIRQLAERIASVERLQLGQR